MVYIRLIYVYSVISVNDKRLPGNTKKWTLVRSWLIRERFVYSWAVSTPKIEIPDVKPITFRGGKPIALGSIDIDEFEYQGAHVRI